MSDPKPQPVLTRRPIICTRCMHGNSVEIITGREKTPFEYHCGCGNYAVVGMPARWPFMEVVKASPSVNPANNISRNDLVENISEKRGSPLQVGESLTVKPANNIPKNIPRQPQARKTIADKTAQDCKQEEPMVTEKDCKEHGITLEQYKANKRWRTEPLKSVSARIKWQRNPSPEDVGAVRPAPPPPPPKPAPLRVEVKQAEPEPVPLLQIFLDPELLEKLAKRAKAEYRTPEQQAAYLIDKGTQE